MTVAEIIAAILAGMNAAPVLAKGIGAAVDAFHESHQALRAIPPGTSTWRATVDAARTEMARREAAAKEHA